MTSPTAALPRCTLARIGATGFGSLLEGSLPAKGPRATTSAPTSLSDQDRYHERTDTATARALGRKGERDKLAEFAQAQLEEVEDVMKALRFGWAWVGRGRLRA